MAPGSNPKQIGLSSTYARKVFQRQRNLKKQSTYYIQKQSNDCIILVITTFDYSWKTVVYL